MTLEKWKKISTETVHTNPWFSYKIDDYLATDGNEAKYYYAFTYGSVFIIPITEGGKILMVKQYRYLNDRFSFEFPGGGIKENEDEIYASRKELIEETGFDGDFEKVGMYNPCNGLTNEICHVFIARNLHPSHEFTKDSTEEFEVEEYSVAEIEEMIFTNEIYDGMTLASWAMARRKLDL
jgi:ADP-ribose pyrophosphatase